MSISPVRHTRPYWLLVIPFLLLAGRLAARQMTTDAYSSDEVASMIVAGGAHFGPFTPVDAWNRVAEHSPDQAIGLALILSSWGRVFGWSEFSTRALPFFAGLLALAWLYRAGRDLFSPAVGLVAMIFLSLSVFFVTYMRVTRVFTLVALLVVFVLWCYWRMILHPRPPGIAAQIGLAVGSIGLLYAHYFGALLLLALGLYHLLLAPKNARWWRTLLLLAVAAIAFLPELSVFIQGYQRNLGKEELHSKALTPLESLGQLLYYLSNGNLAFALLLCAGALTGIAWYVYRGRRNRNLSYTLFLTAVLLILILVANALLQVMTAQRIRYMMPLWPLLALLAALGILQTARLQRGLPWLLLGLWIVFSLWVNLATDLQYQFDLFTRYPLHRARAELLRYGAESDLLVIDGFWRGNGRTREFYLGHGLPMDRVLIYPETSTQDLLQDLDGHLRLWLATEERSSQQSADFSAALENDFVHCTTRVDAQFLVLDLYAQADAFCPADSRLLVFGDAITLVDVGSLTVDDGTLQIDMAWQVGPDVLPDTYSVGLHVFESGSSEVVAQIDYGLPASPYAIVRRSIDLSALSSGAYQLRVTVYEWQTGARLIGMDQRDGTQGDLLPIGTIEID